MPYNYKPVGTERINGDGYIYIKVADPRTWKAKHRIIWEEVNGVVPKGHALIFADGNRLNVVFENLVLVSKRQLAVMNKHRLIAQDADLTKTGVIVADVYLKIGERKRKER